MGLPAYTTPLSGRLHPELSMSLHIPHFIEAVPPCPSEDQRSTRTTRHLERSVQITDYVRRDNTKIDMEEEKCKGGLPRSDLHTC